MVRAESHLRRRVETGPRGRSTPSTAATDASREADDDDDRTLAAVLYEVHNTFGESYAYVQKRDGHDIPTTKQLHVSPFFSMTGHYEFTVTEPDQDLNVAISYFDDEGSSLFAGFKGTGIPFTAPNLAKTIVQAPLATLGITLDIHWQAFRLWLKGLRIYHKPKQQDVQHG